MMLLSNKTIYRSILEKDMKRIYIKPEIEEVDIETMCFLASSVQTEWEMNPDGNNGTGIPGGNSHDPDADDTTSPAPYLFSE